MEKEKRGLFMKRPLSLTEQILIGVALGIIFGAIFGERMLVLSFIGDMFIGLLKMMVIPLVFFAIASAVLMWEDFSKIGKFAGEAVGFYLLTTAVAIILGLLVANLLNVGAGVGLEGAAKVSIKAAKGQSWAAMIVGLIPKSPIKAMADWKILQIIVFALFFGSATLMAREKGKGMADWLTSGTEVVYSLVQIVISLAPYGFFVIMAGAVGKLGLGILVSYAKILAVVYGVGIFHIIVIQGIIVAGVIGGLNPWRFLKGMSEAIIFAWVSDSSAATLPITIKNAEENVGIPKDVTRFVLPLGMTINMDGTALYQGAAAVFIANAYGIDLSMMDQLTIVITATLASIGTVGLPSSGFVMLSIVLTGLGLPLEGLALLAGVEPIMSRFRTCPNICGDAAISAAIARINGYKIEPPKEQKLVAGSEGA